MPGCSSTDLPRHGAADRTAVSWWSNADQSIEFTRSNKAPATPCPEELSVRISDRQFARVNYDHITTDRDLQKFCQELASEPTIAFDTEFVSEHTYRPELCLIQVAAGERLAVIDPQPIHDVKPFWELLAAPGHDTIVHAGREELLFCLAAVGQPPERLFDVQIAAGLVGYEYPAGYGSLMFKLLGQRLNKGETRTDWRRRPLSDGQIEYALDDVRYLETMAAKLRARLEKLRRTAWLDDEMAAWMSDVEATRSGERWWKVSGTSGLSRRSLAVVRELWRWRETEAERRDCPTRRVLRDDLIIELAKRRSTDAAQIRSLRGMERGDLQRVLPQLAAAIGRGLALSDEECPVRPEREPPAQLAVLGPILDHRPWAAFAVPPTWRPASWARPATCATWSPIAWVWPKAMAATIRRCWGAAGGPRSSAG